MKGLITAVIILLSISRAFSTQDTSTMTFLVKNLFDAKIKLEGAIILSDTKSTAHMSKSSIRIFFTNKGITNNVDSLGKIYDFSIQQIKDRKVEFLQYYNDLSKTADTSNYLIYNFNHPYSSTIDKRAIMSYHDCVRLIQQFLINLDHDRLPSLKEANDFLRYNKLAKKLSYSLLMCLPVDSHSKG